MTLDMAEDRLKNPGIEFNPELINVNINNYAVHNAVKSVRTPPLVKKYEIAWLLKAITLIDLTTLSGDDSWSNVARLCAKAHKPVRDSILKKMTNSGDEFDFFSELSCGGVCVYPGRVGDATEELKRRKANVSVAMTGGGFPCGLTLLPERISEVFSCPDSTEVDIVLNRSLVSRGLWSQLFQEIRQMRQSYKGPIFKVILSVGELGSLTNVYKASMVAMMAGADFIKTSTGKEAVNANLPAGIVMCRAIRDYYRLTKVKVGLKPAGGLRTYEDALDWLFLVHRELGKGWLDERYLRLGASSLLGSIEQRLFFLSYGYNGPSQAFKIV